MQRILPLQSTRSLCWFKAKEMASLWPRCPRCTSCQGLNTAEGLPLQALCSKGSTLEIWNRHQELALMRTTSRHCSCVWSVNTTLLANTQGILPSSIVAPLTSFALNPSHRRKIVSTPRSATAGIRTPEGSPWTNVGNIGPIATFCNEVLRWGLGDRFSFIGCGGSPGNECRSALHLNLTTRRDKGPCITAFLGDEGSSLPGKWLQPEP